MPVVLTPAAVWLGAVVTFAFLLAFDKTFRALFAPLLTKVANTGFGGVYGHGSIHPLGFLNGVVHNVEEWTRQGMLGCERAMSWGLETMRASMHEISLTLQDMAGNYKAAFDNVWHGIQHVVPKVIHQTIVRPVEKAAHYSDAKLRARVGALAGAIAALKLQVGHLAHVAGGEVAALPARVGITSRQLRRLSRRLSKVEKATIGLGAVALVATALGRMKLGWLRCPALLRMGRKLGCAGFGWMESFFASAFEALVVLDLCRFALAAQSLARIIVPQLAGTLLVQNAVCLGGGASFPSAYDKTKISTKIVLPSAHD